MKITIEERAALLGLSKDYYKRCKKRKQYDELIDKCIELVKNKIVEKIRQ